tara:strand:- start:1093 stop:1377 length:285 start_codon:yes stop_codon:yes gene_type:complete
MVRYNAAHCGTEEEVFPTAQNLQMLVVTYNGFRWGALLDSTPDDPPNFNPSLTSVWYRFTLCHPAVSVALMAPNGRAELEENLEDPGELARTIQ